MKTNRVQLFTYYVVIGLSWASTYLYSPTLSVYAASLGMSGSAIGVITGGFGLILMLGRAPSGMLSAYLGKSRCIIIMGMTAAFLAPLGMLLFPFPAALIIFRAISGLTAAIWPVLLTSVVNQCEANHAPLIVSRCNLVNALGNIIGMLIGGVLVEKFSQNAAFGCASVFGFCALILSMRMPETYQDRNAKLSFRAMLQVAKDRRLIFLAMMVTVFQIVITGTAMTFTPVLGKSLGASAEALGFLTMLSMLGMLCASTVSVPYTKLLGGVRPTIVISFLVLAASTIGIGLCRSLELLYILQLVQGFGGYMVMIVLMGDSLLPYDNSRRGAASGLFQSVFAAGMFLGPILSGALYDVMSLKHLYFLLATFACVAAVLMFAFYQQLDHSWQQKDT